MYSADDIKNKILEPDNLYLTAWLLYLTQAFLKTTSWYSSLGETSSVLNIFQVLRYLTYLIALVSLIKRTLPLKHLFFLFVLLINAVLIAWRSDDNAFAFMTFFIITAYGVDEKKIIKSSTILITLLCLITVVMSQTGIFTDYTFDLLTRQRHSLGFSWTTYSSIYFLFVTFGYCFLRSKKIKNLELLVLLSVSIILFELTNTRFAMLIEILFLLMVLIFKYIGNNEKIMNSLKWLLILSPLILCFFAIGMYVLYDPGKSIWIKLNSLLSSRLRLGSTAIKDYGITLFGQEIKFRGHGITTMTMSDDMYNYVDCSYLQILLKDGLAGLIIVILEYMVIIKKAIANKDGILLCSIICIELLCITEPFLYNVTYNVFPLLTFALMSEGRKDTEKEII